MIPCDQKAQFEILMQYPAVPPASIANRLSDYRRSFHLSNGNIGDAIMLKELYPRRG